MSWLLPKMLSDGDHTIITPPATEEGSSRLLIKRKELAGVEIPSSHINDLI